MDNQNQDYNFILNPEQQRTKGPKFVGPQKLLMIVGLFAVVTVVVVILFSVILGGGSNNRENLVTLQAHQTELARVLNEGVDRVADPALRQQFKTLEVTTLSDKTAISSIVTSREIEVEKIELTTQLDIETDAALDEAEKAGNFDSVFEQIVIVEASDYLEALEAALASASTKAERDALSVAINNVQTIAQ